MKGTEDVKLDGQESGKHLRHWLTLQENVSAITESGGKGVFHT